MYVFPARMVLAARPCGVQVLREWIRDCIATHRLVQAQDATGHGDDANSQQEIEYMAEMDSLIAEIDRHARTQTRTRFCGRFTVTCVRRIQASRTMSESAKADRAKVPGEIRQEAMDGLKRSKQKKKAANKHLDNADEDLDGGGGDDTGLGKVPCVTPNKGTRTNRTWGTPDTGSGSQTGSDDVPCFEASLASFAQSKKESLRSKELQAEAAKMEAETRARQVTIAEKESEARIKDSEAQRAFMLQMAGILGNIMERSK